MKISFEKAFRKAAKELGIKITAPFYLKVWKRRIKFDLHVADFGRPKGTLVLCWMNSEFDTKSKIAEKAGFFYSGLGTGYAVYERQSFMDTFDDWGWFGKGKPPTWYTGKFWGQSEKKDS